MTPSETANAVLVATQRTPSGRIGIVSKPGLPSDKSPFQYISGAVKAVFDALPLPIAGAIGSVPVTRSVAASVGRVGNETVRGVSQVTNSISGTIDKAGQGIKTGLSFGVIALFVILALYLVGPGILRRG